MRVKYGNVIYNCYNAKPDEQSKTIKITAMRCDGTGNCIFEIYFKNTTSMYNCFDDLLINGYVNTDKYDVY